MTTQIPPMNAHILAQQLLDAQVEHWRQRLVGADALTQMVSILDDVLVRASHFTLNELVTREAIHGVVRTYAFELNLGGGILELVGAMARGLYQVWQQHPPRLRDLTHPQNIEQWIDKIVELQPLRQHIIRQLQHSPLAKNLLSQLIIQTLQRQLPDWLAAQAAQHPQYSLRGKLMQRLLLSEVQLVEWLSQHIAAGIQHSDALDLDDQMLTDFLQQLWIGVREVDLDQHAIGLTALDVEEFFVLMYENWKHLRQTEHLQRWIYTGIDVFFEVYGDYAVTDLLDEVGVTQAHMVGEIERFVPMVLQALDQSGDLTDLIEAQLQPFYQDQITLKLLSDALDAHDAQTS